METSKKMEENWCNWVRIQIYHIPHMKKASKYPLSNNNNADSMTKYGVLGRLDVQIVAVHPLKRHRWGTGQKRCLARAQLANAPPVTLYHCSIPSPYTIMPTTHGRTKIVHFSAIAQPTRFQAALVNKIRGLHSLSILYRLSPIAVLCHPTPAQCTVAVCHNSMKSLGTSTQAGKQGKNSAHENTCIETLHGECTVRATPPLYSYSIPMV